MSFTGTTVQTFYIVEKIGDRWVAGSVSATNCADVICFIYINRRCENFLTVVPFSHN